MKELLSMRNNLSYSYYKLLHRVSISNRNEKKPEVLYI